MLKIESLYAWVATDRDGNEGVTGHEMILDGRLMFAPLIGADRARIESYREHAKKVAGATGYAVRLIEFSSRKALEEKP